MEKVKMKIKKHISLFLSIVVVITSCSLAYFAKAQKSININSELLDSVLSDRYWVIETLVNGDISNNPYSYINPSSTSQNLLDEVLENYQNNAAFKELVDAMDVYSNTGQYVSGLSDDVLSQFESWFGSSDSVDKVIASTDELKYESILNDIIKTDYTSSWGDTLFDENMNLETLKQRSKVLKKLSVYQTSLKDIVGLNHSESSSIIVYDPYNAKTDTYEIDIDDYVGHFLNAYEQDLGNYLNSVVEIPAVNGNEALKKKILSTGALGLVTAYERTAIPKSDFELDDVYYDGMYEDTMKIMKGAGKTLDIVNKTIDYAILLESLQSQKNTTVQSMSRVADTTSNADLAKVLDNYADLVNSAGDKKTLAYETITNYLRNEQIVTNIVSKEVKETSTKLIKSAANKYAGAKTMVLANAIAKSIAIAELSIWVADQTTGIQDTAKKIYTCKYLNKIINETQKCTQADILAYKKNKTEENAEIVLSDLQFLKELRLYGEKSAYGSMSAQMDSWIGILLGGGETKDYLDRRYQASIDTYLGCTFTPVTNNEFTLSKGDVLNISSENVNGKEYTQAEWKKSNGTTLYFAEVDYRLMGGIDLNGATINVLNAPNGIYFPLLENDSIDSVINIYSDNVAFGTISNSSSMTIEVKKAEKTFEITDSIINSGTLSIKNNLSTSKISINNINNTGNINVSNCVLQCKGSPTNNGKIAGMVDICSGSPSYENAYFTIGSQAILGTGTYTDLYFTNSTKQGIKISGTQTVTDYISNPNCRLRSGENIVLTGNCTVYDNKFNSSLSFKDFTSSVPLTINGTGYVYNDVNFNSDVTFNDSLNVTSSCKTLTLNGETNVKGDLKYSGGTIIGDKWLKLYGNLDAETSSPTISHLDFVGRTSQSISSSNPLTVSNLNNHNTSLSGVEFNCLINVTDSLQSGPLSDYKNGKNVVLTKNAKLGDGKITGNISAKDWTCSNSAEIKGTLYSSNAINVADGVQLVVSNYQQSGGTLTICKNALLNCLSDFSQSGSTTNNGQITVVGDGKITSSFIGGTFKIKGDLSLSNVFSPDNLIFESKTSQRFSNSSNTTVKSLTIDNSSISGFTVGSVINVSETFDNKCKKLINGENIVLTNNANYISDETTNGDFSVSGSYVVSKGETLTVNGKLNLKPNSSLTVEDGATLIVKRNVDSNSATVNVENGGMFQVNDYLNSSSDNFNINGNMLIKGDAKINSSTVNAAGLITFEGDLNVSSGTWNKPNLSFNSKLPQIINGSSINVNNLNVKNSSKTGITFNSTINYFGEYSDHTSLIHNSNNIVKKS